MIRILFRTCLDSESPSLTHNLPLSSLCHCSAMSNIIYPDCHCDDQTLNNLLASLRLDAPSRQIPPRAPLVPTRPRLVPTDYPSPSPSRPPITSGSAISNEHHTTPPSAHTSFGSPVDPPRPLDSPPPYPNFDPADIACWERDPDINPFGPLERTYNMSVGSETGIIHTWYVSHWCISHLYYIPHEFLLRPVVRNGR